MIAFKVDRIASAYSKLRISGLTVEPNQSDLELALGELENMMAEWQSRGMSVGYNFENEPDPNSDLGVPQWAWNAINCNLAVRLIADFNKQVPDALMLQASQSLSSLAGRCAADRVRQVAYPARQPVGSGTRVFWRWARFYNDSQALPPNDPQLQTIMQGETNDFQESFEAYLRTNEAVINFEVVSDTGLVVVTSSFDSPVLHYRLEAPVELDASIWQQVKITITTDLGRVEVRVLNFEVQPYVRVGTNA